MAFHDSPREQGLLGVLSSKKRGRKVKDELERELDRLRRDNERLQARLEQAETYEFADGGVWG